MISSNCTVRLELDDDQQPPVFDASEPLTGTVYVEVDDEVDCNGLVVYPEWETHGRGNHASGGSQGKKLFEGTWQPGKTYEYPVELELPPGPYTYRGHYINVDWTLVAEADIPWAMDPGDEVEFVLEPGGRDRYVAGETTASEFQQSRPDDDNRVSWARTIFGFIFMVFPAVMIAGFILGSGGEALAFGAFFSVFNLLFLALGAWLFYTGIRNVFAEAQLGDVDVELSDAQVAPGGTVECRVTMDPPGEVDLNNITCTLKGYEKARSGHGTNSTTYTQTLYETQVVPEGSKSATIDAHDNPEFTAHMTIPDQPSYSFDADDNNVNWELNIHVDVPSWPDWNHTEPMLVRPRFGAEETGPGGDAEAGEDDGSEEEYAVTW
jgi:hypothetical protein